MSLAKSLLITCLIFTAIGFGIYQSANKEMAIKTDSYLIEAKDLFQRGHYEQAVKKLEFLPSKENLEDYYYTKMMALFRLRRFYEAEKNSIELLKINDKNPIYYYQISLIHYNNLNFDKSRDNLIKAVDLEPENISYKLSLARILTRTKQNNEALKYYKQVREQDPNFEVAWAEAASIYEEKKQYQKALKLREEAAEKFSNNLYDQIMLAKLYEKINKKQKAIALYKIAASMDKYERTDARRKLNKLTGKKNVYKFETITSKIPIKFKSNLAIINVKLNGIEGRFLIDTGASSSVIYKNLAQKYNLTTFQHVNGILEMADGQKEFAPLAYGDFQLGKIKMKNIRIFIMPAKKKSYFKFDGIIGMNLLNKLDFYIDKDQKCLILSK